MEYDIEIENENNFAIGRIKFYEGTGYDLDDDTYCFNGMFTRLEKAKYSDDILESTEIYFEIWLVDNNHTSLDPYAGDAVIFSVSGPPPLTSIYDIFI